jgi:arylsulfatase A-like enzyme
LIVNGPGVASGVSAAIISDVDLAPTLCAAVGAAPLPFADGLDVWEHFRDPTQATRDAAFVEHRNGFGDCDYASVALVTADVTYARYQDGSEELSDLGADPDERYNHASTQPERCRRYRDQMLDHLLSTQARGPEQLSQA